MVPKLGNCIFCPRPGRLTKQHIWPEWLKKINQPHVTSHTQIGLNARYDAPERVNRKAKLKQGHSGTRRARKVCKACNNGWIERLEERIRPYLSAMMFGEAVLVGSSARTDLAKWCVLVTMMAEFIDPDTISIPDQDYQFMYENPGPPLGWKIWLARYVGEEHDRYVLRHYALQLADFPDVLTESHKPDTQITTFVIGQFCVHTFRSSALNALGRDYVIGDIPQLWPIDDGGQDIAWPNVRALSSAGVEYLSSALLRQIPPHSTG